MIGRLPWPFLRMFSSSADSFDSAEEYSDFDGGDDFQYEFQSDQENLAQKNFPPSTAPLKSFVVGPLESAYEELRRDLEDLSDSLSLEFSQVCYLVRMFKFNRDRLMENFLRGGDFLKAAGVDRWDAGDSEEKIKQKINKKRNMENQQTCNICDEEYPVESFLSADGLHVCCSSCWSEFLRSRLESAEDSLTTKCPGQNCNNAVPDYFFSCLLSPAEVSKHRRFLLRAFVASSPRIRECPVGCGSIVTAMGGSEKSLMSVKCSCGHSFCFQCSCESHEPSSCSEFSCWTAKCLKESETAQWILVNTKKCPRCNIRIEKNQGCNHVVCKCKFDFCWACEGDWSQHGSHTGGFYKCNKYEPKAAKNAAANAGAPDSEEKAELNRYLFYYQRFHNHRQSRLFAESQRRLILPQLAGVDGEFLDQANGLLIECRRVLQFTYVTGFFLPEGQEKTLFEFLQQQLEASTESLNELIEKPINKIDRPETMNFTQVTRKFLENLLKGVREGLAQQ